MEDDDRYRSIPGEELYSRLAMGEPFTVVDVRTETEFLSKHIPGSTLFPLQQLQSRWREVPNNGTPIALVSEHGNRGVSACRFLQERGIGPLYLLKGGLERWPGPTGMADPTYRQSFGIRPADWLVDNFDLLPMGLALDFAMGEGRNAIYLATRGFDVDGVDGDAAAVAAARRAARRLGAPIRAVVGNLEDGTYIIPIETYDVIIVFNYLDRQLFREIKEGVKPGGVVVYETFTEDSPPHDPSDGPGELLRNGELREVFHDWEILRYHENATAGIVARKPE